MEPVNPLGKVMEMLRRQIAERARKDAPGVAQGGAGAGAARPPVVGAAAVEARVMARLAQLDAAGEGFARRASRVFLDEVLRGEFGDELQAVPEFQRMLDDLQEEWLADAALVAALRDLALDAGPRRA